MGHVVEFPLRLQETEAFEHEDLARLYAAWRQALQAAGRLPPLRDFAPRRLGRWMAWSAIAETTASSYEALADGAALCWRLAGSALCRLAGHELTRRPVFEGWARFERATLTRLLGQTLFRRQAFLARLRLEGDGLMETRLEMLALPLHDVARGQDVALLVFRPSFVPEMMVPAPLATARLTSLRTLEGGMAVSAPAMEAGKGMAHLAAVLPLFGHQPRA